MFPAVNLKPRCQLQHGTQLEIERNVLLILAIVLLVSTVLLKKIKSTSRETLKYFTEAFSSDLAYYIIGYGATRRMLQTSD